LEKLTLTPGQEVYFHSLLMSSTECTSSPKLLRVLLLFILKPKLIAVISGAKVLNNGLGVSGDFYVYFCKRI